MNKQINEENLNSKKVIKHSALGISSFVLSIFSLIFSIFCVIAATNNGNHVILLIFLVCAIPSTVLAIVDLTQSNRKKALPIWALIFNWAWLVLIIIGALFGGIYLFMKTK